MARAKQGKLDGFEEPAIPELEAAASRYYKTMLKRKKVLEEEVEQKDEVQSLMLKHGRKTYEFGDKVITLTTKEAVKVKLKDDDSDIDEPADEEE